MFGEIGSDNQLLSALRADIATMSSKHRVVLTQLVTDALGPLPMPAGASPDSAALGKPLDFHWVPAKGGKAAHFKPGHPDLADLVLIAARARAAIQQAVPPSSPVAVQHRVTVQPEQMAGRSSLINFRREGWLSNKEAMAVWGGDLPQPIIGEFGNVLDTAIFQPFDAGSVAFVVGSAGTAVPRKAGRVAARVQRARVRRAKGASPNNGVDQTICPDIPDPALGQPVLSFTTVTPHTQPIQGPRTDFGPNVTNNVAKEIGMSFSYKVVNSSHSLFSNVTR